MLWAMDSFGEPQDIPTEYLTEIGRVNTRWAALESMMDLCLMKLLGKEITDPRSSIIFNHMALPMKLDIMGALISELLPAYPLLSGFPVVLQALKQAQEKRNIIAHSKWGFNKETKQVEVSRMTSRGKLKTSITPISIGEIKEAADLITKASQDLFVLVTKAGTTNSPPQTGQ
jgi:hypothetical protein